MWARINNGTVVETTDQDPKDRFHPFIEWIACDAQVAPGWAYDGTTFMAPAGPSINGLVADAMARINAGYTEAMEVILAEYPDAETLSFDKQEHQARAWAAWQLDGALPESEPTTAYLDAMLAERPISKTELVTRILEKADQFEILHGAATGRRQKLEDDIWQAQQAGDRAALEAINW